MGEWIWNAIVGLAVLAGLYMVVRIASAAYFHSKKEFLREFNDGIQK